MDFKKTLETLKTKSTPFVEKAKVYGEKALDFTAKQATTTPLFLRTEEEYNIHASSKRSIMIAYDENDKNVKNTLLLLPIWGSKAWMDNADLRYLSLRENSDLARTLKINGPIEMHVAFNGEEYLRTNDMEVIKSWWEKRCYKKDVPTPDTEVQEKPNEKDPLQNVK